MKNKIIAVSCIVAVIMLGLCISILAAPGDTTDPLVTLSFVEDRLSQLENDVDSKLEQVAPGYTPVKYSFNLVEVPKGKSLLCTEGTEFILRQGSATIFATKTGGLSNVTAGYDLPDGTPCPPNALLICSRNDGRGVKANTDLLLLVKGDYTLK